VESDYSADLSWKDKWQILNGGELQGKESADAQPILAFLYDVIWQSKNYTNIETEGTQLQIADLKNAVLCINSSSLILPKSYERIFELIRCDSSFSAQFMKNIFANSSLNTEEINLQIFIQAPTLILPPSTKVRNLEEFTTPCFIKL